MAEPEYQVIFCLGASSALIQDAYGWDTIHRFVPSSFMPAESMGKVFRCTVEIRTSAVGVQFGCSTITAPAGANDVMEKFRHVDVNSLSGLVGTSEVHVLGIDVDAAPGFAISDGFQTRFNSIVPLEKIVVGATVGCPFLLEGGSSYKVRLNGNQQYIRLTFLKSGLTNPVAAYVRSTTGLVPVTDNPRRNMLGLNADATATQAPLTGLSYVCKMTFTQIL